MRKSFILIFCLFLSVLGLTAQNEPPAMHFKLLQASEYNLDAFYSTELHRLFMQVDFSLPKTELNPAYHYGVFLSKQAQFELCTISGKTYRTYTVKNLMPENFDPVLEPASLLNADSTTVFFGIPLNDFDLLPETVKFTFWYDLSVPDFSTNQFGNSVAILSAQNLWYPRNIHSESKVNFSLITIPYLTLQLGYDIVPITDQSYKRTHRVTYIENPVTPLDFRLTRG